MFELKPAVSLVATTFFLTATLTLLPKLPLRAPFALVAAEQNFQVCIPYEQAQLVKVGFTVREAARLAHVVEQQQVRFADATDIDQRVITAFGRTNHHAEATEEDVDTFRVAGFSSARMLQLLGAGDVERGRARIRNGEVASASMIDAAVASLDAEVQQDKSLTASARR